MGEERRVLNAGPFTPFGFHEEGDPPKSTIQFPGGTGGVNWGGAAADPTSGYVYVNAHDTSLVGWIEFKRPGLNYGNGTAGADAALRPRQRERRGPVFQLQRALQGREWPHARHLPCQRPPWGRLVAVNANTGEIAWQTPLGLTEALPEDKQLTGNSGSAGPHGDRWGRGVRRRNHRSSAARLRREERQGAVVGAAGRARSTPTR